jgi:UDP-glucose 4-epimerase
MLALVRNRAGEEAATGVSRLSTDPRTLLLARDEGATPYLFHCCDVRDLVQGLTLLLDQPAAVGEVFNLSGPAPFSYDQVIPYLAEKIGAPYVDASIPGPPIRIHHSTAKARALLGYAPRYDVFQSIADGTPARKPESREEDRT